MVKQCKKHIKDRADRERLQSFNRSKKSWRDAATLRAIKDGEIDNKGSIGADHDEERPQEWIDDIYCIDIEGEAI